MKILQTIPYMLASQGGPSTCTCDLLEGLFKLGVSIELLTANPVIVGGIDTDVILGEGRPWMNLFECDYFTPLALSKNVDKFLQEKQYEIYHANTLWLYITHATCYHARKNGKPYLLSTHGMLYPSALKVSRLKKKLAGSLWFKNDILNASCIHATCQQEMEHIRAFGFKGPIAVIPNPVVVPKKISLEYIREIKKSKNHSTKQIGFLGRLDPIKKVENVIYALALLRDKDISEFSFQIMGKFDKSYEAFLKAEVKRLNLENSVTFVGIVSGIDKYERLLRLSALMVPSEQENFGMIIPEALISGTPVYASTGTPWSELNEHSCGWWKNNNPETIAEILIEILTLNETDILAMGERGRSLIEEKYEQHKVAVMMKELYEWLLNKKDQPNFVYTL